LDVLGIFIAHEVQGEFHRGKVHFLQQAHPEDFRVKGEALSGVLDAVHCLLEDEILKKRRSDWGCEVRFWTTFVSCGGSLDSCLASSLEIGGAVASPMALIVVLNTKF
jgi:hypothetical protein